MSSVGATLETDEFNGVWLLRQMSSVECDSSQMSSVGVTLETDKFSGCDSWDRWVQWVRLLRQMSSVECDSSQMSSVECDSWARWVQWSVQRWNAFLGWRPIPSGFWHYNFSECSFTLFGLALPCVWFVWGGWGGEVVLIPVHRKWVYVMVSFDVSILCFYRDCALTIAFSLCHDDKLLWNLWICQNCILHTQKEEETLLHFQCTADGDRNLYFGPLYEAA